MNRSQRVPARADAFNDGPESVKDHALARAARDLSMESRDPSGDRKYSWFYCEEDGRFAVLVLGVMPHPLAGYTASIGPWPLMGDREREGRDTSICPVVHPRTEPAEFG